MILRQTHFAEMKAIFSYAVLGRIMKNITNVLNVQFHSSAALFFIQTILLLSYLIKSFELNFEHILLLFEHSFNMDISRSYTIAFMGLHLESEAGAFCALTKPFRKWFYLKWVELAECDNNPDGGCMCALLCCVQCATKARLIENFVKRYEFSPFHFPKFSSFCVIIRSILLLNRAVNR